jgi:hypothetical protein
LAQSLARVVVKPRMLERHVGWLALIAALGCDPVDTGPDARLVDGGTVPDGGHVTPDVDAGTDPEDAGEPEPDAHVDPIGNEITVKVTNRASELVVAYRDGEGPWVTVSDAARPDTFEFTVGHDEYDVMIYCNGAHDASGVAIYRLRASELRTFTHRSLCYLTTDPPTTDLGVSVFADGDIAARTLLAFGQSSTTLSDGAPRTLTVRPGEHDLVVCAMEPTGRVGYRCGATAIVRDVLAPGPAVTVDMSSEIAPEYYELGGERPDELRVRTSALLVTENDTLFQTSEQYEVDPQGYYLLPASALLAGDVQLAKVTLSREDEEVIEEVVRVEGVDATHGASFPTILPLTSEVSCDHVSRTCRLTPAGAVWVEFSSASAEVGSMGWRAVISESRLGTGEFTLPDVSTVPGVPASRLVVSEYWRVGNCESSQPTGALIARLADGDPRVPAGEWWECAIREPIIPDEE